MCPWVVSMVLSLLFSRQDQSTQQTFNLLFSWFSSHMRIPECPSGCFSLSFIELVQYLLVKVILHWGLKPAEPRDRMQTFNHGSLDFIVSGSLIFLPNAPESVCSTTGRKGAIYSPLIQSNCFILRDGFPNLQDVFYRLEASWYQT